MYDFFIYFYLLQDGGGDNGLYEDENEEEKMIKMKEILGPTKAHFMPLIEQLIFMEETHAN